MLTSALKRCQNVTTSCSVLRLYFNCHDSIGAEFQIVGYGARDIEVRHHSYTADSALLVELYTTPALKGSLFLFPVILVAMAEGSNYDYLFKVDRLVMTRGYECSLDFPRLYSSATLVLGNRTFLFPPFVIRMLILLNFPTAIVCTLLNDLKVPFPQLSQCSRVLHVMNSISSPSQPSA